jgi:hypothetical protein
MNVNHRNENVSLWSEIFSQRGEKEGKLFWEDEPHPSMFNKGAIRGDSRYSRIV